MPYDISNYTGALPESPSGDAGPAARAAPDAETAGKQNLRALRDLIAKLPAKRFDMSEIVRNAHGEELNDARVLNHTCGTAGCIAGWAVAHRRALGHRKPYNLPNWFEAKDWLSLSDEQASELFQPEGYWVFGEYTQTAAVATLDHLIETGEVRWPTKSEGA